MLTENQSHSCRRLCKLLTSCPALSLTKTFSSRYAESNTSKNTVGVVVGALRWRSLFRGLFQDSVKGVVCVVSNGFNQVFTLEVNGGSVTFIGFGDLHEKKFDDMMKSMTLNFSTDLFPFADNERAVYKIEVFPSSVLEPVFLTAKPAVYGAVLFVVFAFASLIFMAYDCFVESKQQLVAKSADQARALVNSLFPEVVGERLIEEQTVGHADDARLNPLGLISRATSGTSDLVNSAVPIAGEWLEILHEVV